MTIEIKPTEKDYIMLVNKKEFYDKALEMGYDEPILFYRELDDEDYINIKKTGKNVALFTFAENEDEQKIIANICNRLKEMKSDGITYFSRRFVGLEWQEEYYDTDGENLEFILKAFPKVEEYEQKLMDNEVVYCRNYKNRCGNCQAYLAKKYKYCIECGTEKGKGEFKPYRNGSYCVYGPPVKMKFNCTACGSLWITDGLGGTMSFYCPECGKKKVNTLESKVLNFFDYIFSENPFGIDDTPKMFSDDEVIRILNERGRADDPYGDELLKILRDAGLDFPEKMIYDRMTELQGEQMNLATKILKMEGEKPGKKMCPHCGKVYVASFAYDLVDDHWNKLIKDYYNNADDGTLIYKRGSVKYKGDENESSYLCLNCGNEFGNLEIDEDTVSKLKIMDASTEN